MSRRVVLIVNPASRRGAKKQAQAVRAFAKAGIIPEIQLTNAPGHAAFLAREHGLDAEAVFTLGGDGTAMEVVGALADDGPPVGILPGGTGNVIVRSLGIPLRMSRAVPALLNGDVGHIDLGRMSDGRHFAIGLGVGIDATMIAEANAELKRRFGILAYVIVGVRSALKVERFRVRVTVDGVVHEHEATAVLIANFGTLLHRLISLGEGIQQDDGVLNACIFAPRNAWDSLRIGWRLMRRNFRGDPCLSYQAGTHFLIETFPPRDAEADGEMVGKTPVEITVRPRAARLLLPAKQARRTLLSHSGKGNL